MLRLQSVWILRHGRSLLKVGVGVGHGEFLGLHGLLLGHGGVHSRGLHGAVRISGRPRRGSSPFAKLRQHLLCVFLLLHDTAEHLGFEVFHDVPGLLELGALSAWSHLLTPALLLEEQVNPLLVFPRSCLLVREVLWRGGLFSGRL